MICGLVVLILLIMFENLVFLSVMYFLFVSLVFDVVMCFFRIRLVVCGYMQFELSKKMFLQFLLSVYLSVGSVCWLGCVLVQMMLGLYLLFLNCIGQNSRFLFFLKIGSIVLWFVFVYLLNIVVIWFWVSSFLVLVVKVGQLDVLFFFMIMSFLFSILFVVLILFMVSWVVLVMVSLEIVIVLVSECSMLIFMVFWVEVIGVRVNRVSVREMWCFMGSFLVIQWLGFFY